MHGQTCELSLLDTEFLTMLTLIALMNVHDLVQALRSTDRAGARPQQMVIASEGSAPGLVALPPSLANASEPLQPVAAKQQFADVQPPTTPAQQVSGPGPAATPGQDGTASSAPLTPRAVPPGPRTSSPGPGVAASPNGLTPSTGNCAGVQQRWSAIAREAADRPGPAERPASAGSGLGTRASSDSNRAVSGSEPGLRGWAQRAAQVWTLADALKHGPAV